jgi:acetyl esterase/lipase
MASKQSLANKSHYETLAAVGAKRPMSPEESIEWNERHWPALTAEPRGVDYIEANVGLIPSMWIVPKGATEDRVIFYSHGGGFVGGSIYTHRKMVGHLAKAVGCRALIFDYPYAISGNTRRSSTPLSPSISWLLDQGVRAEHITAAGDSSGAILTFGVLQRGRDHRLPLPSAIMTISGWFDMALTGASYETNRTKDLFFAKEAVAWLVSNMLGESGDRRDPLASPLYADFKGLPPIYLQAGSDETLVDDSRMLAEKARQAGVEVRLDVFPEMLHTFQMMAGQAPEADDAIARLAEWVRPKLALDDKQRTAA